MRDFVSLAEQTEIPQAFMLWCGISGISAALERRVWIDMGPFTIFPNLYIVLVAGSGRCRKSTSIHQLLKIMKQASVLPNFISQKITPEGLIDALRIHRDATISESIGYVVVDELSVFLNRKSYEAGLASLLITLFDCEDQIEYRTKGRGIEKLENTCLSLLGASTIDWLKNAVPTDAIGGGLTSRMIFVYVEHPTTPVAWPLFDEKKHTVAKKLSQSLEGVFTINGPAKLTPDAKAFYEEKYCNFYDNSELFDDPLLSGYASRRFVHFLKLGIIFSVARGARDLVITHSDLLAAENALLMIEPAMPKVLSMVMATDRGALTGIIYAKIAKAGKIGRRSLMASFAHRIDTRELTDLLDTLLHTGKVECFASGSDIVYHLPGHRHH